jgi:hypothetical protein
MNAIKVNSKNIVKTKMALRCPKVLMKQGEFQKQSKNEALPAPRGTDVF